MITHAKGAAVQVVTAHTSMGAGFDQSDGILRMPRAGAAVVTGISMSTPCTSGNGYGLDSDRKHSTLLTLGLARYASRTWIRLGETSRQFELNG